MSDFGFEVTATLPDGRGRAGTIHTPHGTINTPAFVAVGTKATVKAVLPEAVRDLGAQAVLANAYHLYLQPGSDIVDAAGGLGAFMWLSNPEYMGPLGSTTLGHVLLGVATVSLLIGFAWMKKIINIEI